MNHHMASLKPFNPKQFSFGRHETFSLRFGWLTKGYLGLTSNPQIFTDDVIRAYISTSRALSILDTFAPTLQTGTVPRSWVLTGPYGSGKSSFAAFLSHL